MGAALPALLQLHPAPERSGRGSPGSWRPSSKDRQITAQAAAAEPGGKRPAEPLQSAAFRVCAPRVLLVSSAVLRFAWPAVVSRRLKEEKIGGEIWQTTQAFKIWILKAYVWGKVEVLEALGRERSLAVPVFECRPPAFPKRGGPADCRYRCSFWRGVGGQGGRAHRRTSYAECLEVIVENGLDPGMAQADQIENAGETDGCDRIWIRAKSERVADCKLEVVIISWGFPRFSMTDAAVGIKATNRVCCAGSAAL